MIDCSDADIRDRLPDWLHGRLDPETRAQVDAHLAQCPACTDELMLLRAAQRAMRGAPAVDVRAIAAAVPAYQPAPRQWRAWRVAAAVLLLAGGAGSFMMYQRSQSASAPAVKTVASHEVPAVVPPVPSAPVPTRAVVVAESAHQSPATAPRQAEPKAAPARELAMGGSSLNDLSDRELAALLKSIDELDGVPTTDVESGSLSPAVPRRSMQ